MTPNQITAQNAGWPPQFRFAGSVVSSGVCEFHRSARMILCKVLTAALLVVAGHGLSAERIRVPQFGKPLAVSDKLIFAGPGLKPDRLICIEKESGEPAWQITNEVQTLLAWCVLSNWVIVSVGPDLYRCNVELGHLDLLYRTGHEHDAFVYDEQDGTLLVTGGNGRMGYLARVDPGSGRALWERDRHGYVVAQGEKVLLCAESKRFAVATGGYGATDERWVGVSKQDGRALWSCPPNAAGGGGGGLLLGFSEGHIQLPQAA